MISDPGWLLAAKNTHKV